MPQDLQPFGCFPAFYGTQSFITAFTRALHLYLSSAQPISTRSILMLTALVRLGLPSDLFPSGFPTNNLYDLSFSPFMLHAAPIPFASTRSFLFYLAKKLPIMQFSPLSCHFIRLRPNYSPQYPVPKTTSVYVHPLMSETKFHTHREPPAK
jgi:hypothetical protein